MKVAVIGSGHAALSAAQGLIARGLRPVIYDVGETLPKPLREQVKVLAGGPPQSWPDDAQRFASLPANAPLTQKTVFGSDYIFAHDRRFAPAEPSDAHAAPSFAKGGFSMGWGGAVLPARNEDLKAWPVAARELKAHYVSALEGMPLSGANDGLAEAFPVYRDELQSPHMTAQGERLLNDLRAAREQLNGQGCRVLFGAARLAVDTEQCVDCGMCLAGCPYGLIHPLDGVLDDLCDKGQVDYVSGAYVVAVEEDGNGVTIKWLDTNSGVRQTDTFERVFIGAGALSTTRIMLNSLQAYGQSLAVKDSAKFAIPMLRLTGARAEWPATNTLADLFIEGINPDLSEHWLHVQVSPLNERILQKLYMLDSRHAQRLNTLGRVAGPLTGRLMAAWCALHSDLSSECELSVRPGADDLPVLHIKAGAQRTEAAMQDHARWLARLGRHFSTLFVPRAAFLSPACSTGHCGGTLPMRDVPQTPFETDVLGRPQGWARVHVVDASVFPSIPATTIALLIRANARRIVAETSLEASS